MPPIFEVHIEAPSINETVTVAADSPAEAEKYAIGSALARQTAAATVTVEEVPGDEPPPAAA